jgi:acetoin utilization deacetylase AcuC-like enzyme
LLAINRALDASGLRDQLMALEPRPATETELTTIHTSAHVQTVHHQSTQGGGHLDADTYMNSDSWEAALWAAGGALRLVEAVLNGECHNGFALVRPPGHHATPGSAMGFCLFNNIAAAARHAIKTLGLERVAIIDYDVHHGNGTQDIFYSDPQVLFCSTHASPFYPGTGHLNEMGAGDGKGATLNVPLPFGVSDTGYEQVFREAVIPAVRAWKPQLILLSAGFDAHWSDPIGPMVLSVTGYATLTRMVYDLAAEVCDGKLALMLEGGYNLEALAASVTAVLRVLLEQDPGPDPLGVMTPPEPDVGTVIGRLRKAHPLFEAKA